MRWTPIGFHFFFIVLPLRLSPQFDGTQFGSVDEVQPQASVEIFLQYVSQEQIPNTLFI